MRVVDRTQKATRPERSTPTRLIAVVALMALVCPANAAEAVRTRLRLTIDAAEPTALRGVIGTTSGRLLKLQPLNLSPNAAAGCSIADGRLLLHHRDPIGRDALDVTVNAPPDGELLIRLDGQPPGSASIAIGQILDGPQSVRVGDTGVVVSVDRLPSDRLRIETDRQSLVFAPGERFAFDVLADPEGIERGKPYDLTATLVHGRDGEELWRGETHRVEATADGPARLSVEAPLPSGEGVYTLRLTATRPAGFLSRFPTTASAPPALAVRTVQVAVFDEEARPKTPTRWIESYASDPDAPANWRRRVPTWMRLRNLPWTSGGPLSSEDAARPEAGGAEVIAAAEQAAAHWRAYPLPVEQPGQLHAVEIEVQGEPGESLTVAVLEPDALGDLRPVSGAVTHTLSRWNRSAQRKPIRLLLRPRTDSPLLVIANPSTERPARFGGYRLLRASESINRSHPDERLIAVNWSTADLPHRVGASHAPSTVGSHEYADLLTYYETARNVAERVELAGANAAVIGVNENGSAIYDSQVWKAPRFDLGVWSDGAADTPRRELLRLIAAEFRRRGLKLIPALRFDTRAAPIEAVGGGYLAGSQRLCQVQRAIIDEVIDVTGEDLIAGVAVRVTAGGWELLNPSRDNEDVVADRLVSSYHAMAAHVRRRVGDPARIFLLPRDITSGSSLASEFSPRFGVNNPSAVSVIERLGLSTLQASDAVALARETGGWLGAPLATGLAANARLAVLEEVVGSGPSSRVVSFHSDRHAVRLFDSGKRLQGGDAAKDILLPAVVAEPDAQASLVAGAFDGSIDLILLDGATAVGSLDETAAEQRVAFTRSPQGGDLDTDRDSTSDIVAAARTIGPRRSHVTVVNRSAWTRTAQVTIETPQRLRGQITAESGVGTEWFNAGRHAIDVSLAPYETTVWRFDGPEVRVAGVRIEPNAAAQRELAEAVADLQSRDTTARRAFAALPNPSFEGAGEAGGIEGWETGAGVEVDSDRPIDGQSSARLVATAGGQAVLMSEPFAMPTTGQFALGMRLRPRRLDPSAELRLEVLQVGGSYRNSTRLTGDQLNGSAAATDDWLPPIIFPIDDLPLLADGQLQLRFTLAGEGELNLDKLEAEDLLLPLDGFGSIELRSEKFALVRLLSASQSLLDEGRLEACRELLDSYWARFLIENFPAHQAEQAIAAEEKAGDEPPAPPAEKSPSISQRLRGYLPRWWR